MTKRFGKRLQVMREKAGFETRVALAQAAGVSPKLVDLYESGQLSSPRYATVVKFAKALHVTVADLMDGTDAA